MQDPILMLKIGLIAAAAVVGSALYWALICMVLARLGGWRRLAKDYTLTTLPPGEVLTWQSAGFGKISYRNVLKVAALPDGLYLAMPLLFAAGHPALVVPWTKISNYHERRILFLDAVEFQIAATDGPVRVQILKKLAERLALPEHLGEG